MPPRSSWKGFIKLSLVSVPVKAYTANSTGSEIRLNQLHEECNSRIQYKKNCPLCGEVSNDSIVSGYEYSKGQYVVIDPAEVSKLRKESDKSVNIDGFIPADAIDPIYYAGRSYYLAPDGAVGQKPYALLVKGMADAGLFAVARAIISSKEHVVILRPAGDLLIMALLNYKNRLKSPSAFEDEVTECTLTKEELKLTRTLIDASTLDDFDFSSYEDDYTTKLTELIEHKVAGSEIVEVADPEEPKIINLMEALKESVARAQGAGAPKKRGRKAAPKSTRKMAPSGGGAAKKTTAKKKKKSG